MTIVAVWPDEGFIWCAADTRVSSPGASGGIIVQTDRASKILLLPIKISTIPSNSEFLSSIVYLSSWGIAFAGDVGPFNATYAAVSTFLQNLTVHPAHTALCSREALLSIEDIAALIARIGSDYMRSYLAGSSGRYGLFEVALFGCCPAAKGYRVAHLAPELSPASVGMSIRVIDPASDPEPLIMGERAVFEEQMAHFRQHGDPYERSARVPRLVLEAIVKRSHGSVGGSLSFAVGDMAGVRLFGLAEPESIGQPRAVLSFNGIPLEGSDAMVGRCSIGLSYLA